MDLIIAENAAFQRFGENIFQDTNFCIKKGKHIYVTGNNGAGKTSLLKGISKQYPLLSGNLKFPHFEQLKIKNPELSFSSYLCFVDFNLHHYLPNYLEKFYQQRYHSCELDVFPSVFDFLYNERNIFIEKPEENILLKQKIQTFLSLFNLESLKNESVIELSNGENKKLIIIKALLKDPEILILDNPYLGLDESGVMIMELIFKTLDSLGKTIILSNADNCYSPIFKTKWTINKQKIAESTISKKSNFSKPDFLLESNHKKNENTETIFKIVNGNITYGDKIIFKNINWTIKTGEKWILKGKNGSGKSSLLGLIFADHPQAYKNEIYLFGKKRGTGESIWDIKAKIGYLSPELYLHFLKPYTCLEIVASGINEYKPIDRNYSEEEIEKTNKLLQIFNLEKKVNSSFLNISFGEQRLVLLLRAIIKQPKLLILDEPFQGIDEENQNLAMDLLNGYFQENKSSSMVLITHQNDFEWKIINREIELKNGNIQYIGEKK